MAILASGKIQTFENSSGVPEQYILYRADQDVRITFMQFVSEGDSDVTINVSLVLFTDEVRVIPKDTTLKTTNILQFDVNYELQDIEYIFVTSNTDNVINYLIRGEYI